MAKAARKLAGFLWALLIAILSFFIIFIFFPDVSNRFFGVSIKGEDVQRIVKEVGDTVSETVSNAVDKAVDKAAETAADVVTEKIPEIVNSTEETVSDALKKYSNQSN